MNKQYTTIENETKQLKQNTKNNKHIKKKQLNKKQKTIYIYIQYKTIKSIIIKTHNNKKINTYFTDDVFSKIHIEPARNAPRKKNKEDRVTKHRRNKI